MRSAPKSQPRSCFHLAKEAGTSPWEATTLPSSPPSSFIPSWILIYAPGWSARRLLSAPQKSLACFFLPRLPADTRLQPPEEQGRAFAGLVFWFFFFIFLRVPARQPSWMCCTEAREHPKSWGAQMKHRGSGTREIAFGFARLSLSPQRWGQRRDGALGSTQEPTGSCLWVLGFPPNLALGPGVSPKPSLRAPGAPDRGGHSPSLAPSHLTATAG